jgi:hypothetical protein
VNSELGVANSARGAPQPTTIGSLTLGVTYKPVVSAPIAALLILPETRWDQAFTGTHPFNRGVDDKSFTVASDFVLTF